MSKYIFPTIMILLDLGAAVLCGSQGDVRKVIYWIAAAEFMYSAPDKICFENCTKETGNKYSCKFGENVDLSNCIKCMKQYLESEVTE